MIAVLAPFFVAVGFLGVMLLLFSLFNSETISPGFQEEWMDSNEEPK